MRTLRSIWCGLAVAAIATAQVNAATTAGTLSLSADKYSVSTSAGSLAVKVNRTGGSTGAVSVVYSTYNGTAKAGIDYTSKAGMLRWNSGDAAAKTISIPINSTGSGGKYLALWIVGANGATLGTPNKASISTTSSTASSSSSSSSVASSSSSSTSSVANSSSSSATSAISSSSSSASSTSTASSSSSSTASLAVHVQGNHLVNGAGTALQL